MARIPDTLTRRSRGLLKRVRFHNFHWWADPYRVLTKRFASEYPSDPQHLVPVANYSLDRRVTLTEASIIYSAGVGRDVSFDTEVAKQFGSAVYMFDPTPDSIAFVQDLALPDQVSFEPVGVWSENTTLAFGRPRLWSGSASAMILQGEVADFEAECLKLSTIMNSHGHTHLDVLKLDIEGAALPVMVNMLDEQIYPDQIVVEFERPRSGASEFACFLADVKQLCDRLTAHGYEIVILPRTKARYFSLEYLFVKTSAIGTE